ncbi:hypothetical protein D3C76_1076200 [compost metagenome]
MQQAAFDDPIQAWLVREMHGVDIHQRAVGCGTAGLGVLPGVALDLERRAHAGLEQALTGADGKGEASHGGKFQ